MHSVFMIPNNLDNRKDTQIIHLPVSRVGMLVEKSVSRLEGFYLCEDSPKLLFYLYEAIATAPDHTITVVLSLHDCVTLKLRFFFFYLLKVELNQTYN